MFFVGIACKAGAAISSLRSNQTVSALTRVTVEPVKTSRDVAKKIDFMAKPIEGSAGKKFIIGFTFFCHFFAKALPERVCRQAENQR